MLLNRGGGQKKVGLPPQEPAKATTLQTLTFRANFREKEQQCRGFQVMTEWLRRLRR